MWREMQKFGVTCDRATYVSLLRTAAAARTPPSLILGLWDHVRKSNLLPNAPLYDAMLQACVHSKAGQTALEIWREMAAHELEASSFAAVALIRSCSSLEDLAVADALLLLSEYEGPGAEKLVVARLAVLGELVESGNLLQLPRAWDMMEEASKRGIASVAIYNTLITVCGKARAIDQAFKALDHMRQAGLPPTKVTYQALIAACQRSGELEKALSVFQVCSLTVECVLLL